MERVNQASGLYRGGISDLLFCCGWDGFFRFPFSLPHGYVVRKRDAGTRHGVELLAPALRVARFQSAEGKGGV